MYIPTYWPTDNEWEVMDFKSTFKKHSKIKYNNWRQVATSGKKGCEALAEEIRRWNTKFPEYPIQYQERRNNKFATAPNESFCSVCSLPRRVIVKYAFFAFVDMRKRRIYVWESIKI